MRISDWSSDVCSSDLRIEEFDHGQRVGFALAVSLRGDPGNIVGAQGGVDFGGQEDHAAALRSVSVVSDSSASPKARTKSAALLARLAARKIARLSSRKTSSRSEEHTSELQSLMRISYAVFCL